MAFAATASSVGAEETASRELPKGTPDRNDVVPSMCGSRTLDMMFAPVITVTSRCTGVSSSSCRLGTQAGSPGSTVLGSRSVGAQRSGMTPLPQNQTPKRTG